MLIIFVLNIDKGHCYIFICGQLNPSLIEQHGPFIDTSVLDTCSSALSPKRRYARLKKKGEQNKQLNLLEKKSWIQASAFNVQCRYVTGSGHDYGGDPLIEVELQMDTHMDHTEIPVIETDEPLFDVLPKLFK